MTRVLRYCFRALIGMFALLLLIIAGLTIYLRTESFNQLLVREVNGALQGRFRGQIGIGGIRTPQLGLIEIHNVTVAYQGRELLRVPLIDASYALIPVLWHQIDLTIAIDQPNVHVSREARGKWDLAEALQSSHPAASSGPSAYNVTISALQLKNGTITVAPDGPNQPRYLASAANLDARIALTRSGLEVRARELSAHLVVPNAPPADINLAAAYDESRQPPTLVLSSLSLTTKKSSLSATATVTNPASPTILAQITIVKLAPGDLASLHRYPLRDDLAGSITVSGPRNALHALMALNAGPASVKLDATADLAGRQPAYHGTLGLAHLDLSRLVLGAKLAGRIDASIQMQGAGTELDSLQASVKAGGRGLVISQIHAGNIDLTLKSKNNRAQLAATMRNGASQIKADISAANFIAPAIKAQIMTRHLDLRALTAARPQPQTDLNATLMLGVPRLDRANLNLAHLDAHVLLTLARSTIRQAVIANGIVDAALHNGVVSLTRLNLSAQGATLTGKGRIGVVPHSITQLAYALNAPHLAPVLRMAQVKGDGSLDLSGSANGVIVGPGSPSLATQGRAVGSGLNINGVAAGNAHASYNLSKIGQGVIPLGGAQLQLADVAFGTTRLRTLDLNSQLTRQKPAALNLALAIVDAQSHAHSASLSLATQGVNVAGTLTELAVTAPDGVWRLSKPAHFAASSRAITINQFDVRNGPRELALHGTMRIAGPQAVGFTARDLDLGLIQPLLQANQHPAGTIGADITIAGTADAPIIRADLTGQGLAVNQQRIGDLNLRANYNPGSADVNGALYQDRSHQMTLTGTVPLTIAWTSGFHIHLGNDVALRLYSSGLRLAGLAALAPPRTIKNATGQLAFDLAISGQPFHPAANGTLALDNLGVEVIPLGLTISQSFVHMRITPDRFTLEQLAINAHGGPRSGSGGSIIASGGIALANYTVGAANLNVEINQFPAIHTQQYQATIGGSLHLGGTPNAPDVSGRVEVLNATIRPDLAFLTSTKYARDDTIVVIRPGDEIRTNASGNTKVGDNTPKAAATPAVHSSLFDQLAINVAIIVHRNTWIRHPEASVELAGQLQAVKQRGGPLSLVGEIDTVRGWITFNGQTFTLVSGQILFTGGHRIDPSLNLDAQYTVSQYTVDVLVTGFASKPKVKLQSTPSLPQSDILSLLLFGKTSSSLGQSQSASLQQQAAQMAAGAAASTIGQSLASSLGLGALGIDVNSSGSNGVGVGRYIGKNTYLSASQSTTGRKVSIQYYVKRWVSITTSTNADGSSEIFLNLIKQY